MSSRCIHRIPQRWLFIFIVLSTAPALRIGDVQILEIVQVARFLLIALFVAHTGPAASDSPAWRRYGSGFLLFLCFTLLLSLASLRLPFYPPSEISVLKLPVVLSLSRISEVALAIYFMLAISNTLATNSRLIRASIDLYTAAGTMTAFAGILAFATYRLTGETTFLINDLDHRLSGLFNEGGPYGLFLTSIMLLFLLRRRIYPYTHRTIACAGFAIVFVAWILAASKAGILAAIFCGIAGAAAVCDARKRLLALLVTPLVCLTFFFAFQRGLVGYITNFSHFDETVLFRPQDRNLVMGRIVGAFVVPRMIAAHPFLGIGLGNYSLMRNDPNYLQGLPAVDDWDLPGLGLISDAAELGVPLTLFLILLLCRPLRHARKMRARPVVVAAAVFQPVALLLGVSLNFFYPWLVSAFVMACLLRTDQNSPAASSITRRIRAAT